MGIGRRRRVRRRAARAHGARHRDHAAPARRPGGSRVGHEAALDHSQVLRPHRAADPDEEGGVEGRRAAQDGRGRDGQPGVRVVGAPQERDHRRAVPRVLQARRPRLRRPARVDSRPRRGPAGIHGAFVRARARAVRPVGPQCAPRHPPLHPARVRDGRRRAVAAAVPALRPRHRRLERPAAQRFARDPAGITGHRGDPRRMHAQDPRPAAEPRRERTGEVRDVLARIRRRAEGGRRRGLRQQGQDRGARALRVDAFRHGRPERFACRLRRADEGGAGAHLLRHRGVVQRGALEPASRSVPAQGHRGAADVRSRRRMVREPRDRVRRQAARVRCARRTRPRQARGRGGAEGGRSRGGRGEGRRREDPQEPRRARQGRPRHAAAHRFTCVPRCRRARHEREPRADAEGGGPAGAGREADPRDQPEASGRRAAQGRRAPFRRLGERAVRPGRAGRRRTARRSGRLRAPRQSADAGAGRRQVVVGFGLTRRAARAARSGVTATPSSAVCARCLCGSRCTCVPCSPGTSNAPARRAGSAA